MESELPSKLGRLELLEDSWNKVPAETLLSLCWSVLDLAHNYTLAYLQNLSSSSEFNYSKLSAIRYFAGILELPSFWTKEIDDRKRLPDILAVLCKTMLQLIHDTAPQKSVVDIGNDSPGDSPIWMDAARNAVDMIVSATFNGLLRPRDRDVCPHWPSQLRAIISVLLR